MHSHNDALVEQERKVEPHDDEHGDVEEENEDDEGEDSPVGEDGDAEGEDADEGHAHHRQSAKAIPKDGAKPVGSVAQTHHAELTARSAYVCVCAREVVWGVEEDGEGRLGGIVRRRRGEQWRRGGV